MESCSETDPLSMDFNLNIEISKKQKQIGSFRAHNTSHNTSSMSFRVNHSNNAIVKPPELTPQAAAKELESVMKRVREAQSTIAAAIEPGTTFRFSTCINVSVLKQ